ncbi:hypothetical protein CMV_007004 [Castanea mollissima]|uniref:Uncharacterized protein n=1 Tax=Castanea mollissima TaxID=60419 RepID=A0A8J4RIU1_9ROSI|nr:hypothetical protein CMV_007004 [Castanea mollissima]
MDGDSWSARLSSASKRYQSALQSRSDMFMGFEEIDGDDDIREEFPCPFCSEYFDIVGLCCHIDDEHPVEAKNGVCPVCAMRVGVDMVAHITLQHGNIFKSCEKETFSPFLGVLPFSPETSSVKKKTEQKVSERNVQSSPFSIKDQEEKAKRCEFVHGLLLSTILDDNL